jgi:predicted short-subunit dehydrogenase-like oxidoreductase (DUF2520 family)
MRSVAIIGPGRVGGAIALSLPTDVYRVEALIGRADKTSDGGPSNSLDNFSYGSELSAAANVDIIFITTPDSEIKKTAIAVGKLVGKSTTVFHTSGSLTSLVMEEISHAGASIGSIHPLVSISRPDLGPERFRGAYFCIEGEPEAVALGTQIVIDLGGMPFSIDTSFKTLYHASAVMACGHLVALFDSAVEVMTHTGLSAERAKAILLPLVTSTVDNLATQSNSSALTGTFGRADIETFSRHVHSLNENVSDELLEIYLLLGERSLELAASEGVSSDRIDKLRAKMSVAKSKLKW